ncbi:MAG: hypothetical protein PHI45_03055 [Candidatus Pacebacteria bacterium]|nr:hypothetical protein [Candidatus Paceibacterota bacterium]MDD5753032.1 hypothetical protein [Candidatus Paceibacterota bacterium]
MNPYFIKFEKPKKELYLTISCFINNEDGRFYKFRDDILELLKNTGLSIIDLEGENYKEYKQVIARYKERSLHFSLINLLTYNLNGNLDFETMKQNLKINPFFMESKEKGEEIIRKIKIEERGEIRNIYFPQSIENSIAYNLYLKDEDVSFIKAFQNYKTGIKELDNNKKVKINPGDNFSVNIIRFINNEKEDYYLKSDLYKKIEEINLELKNKPIKVKFDLKMVISNPYLSNNEP